MVRESAIEIEHLLATVLSYEESWQRLVYVYFLPAVFVVGLPIFFTKGLDSFKSWKRRLGTSAK